MFILYFRYRNQTNILFRHFVNQDDMYKFIGKEDVVVEKVKELY